MTDTETVQEQVPEETQVVTQEPMATDDQREHQLKQMQEPATQEEDDSQYEPVTKAELKKQQAQIVRDVEEKTWIRQNPEKAEIINEKLANFLKQRPNLTAAIEAASNRYEEAWELMDKLSPRQKAALNNPPATKKVTPNSPSGIPKAAGMNQAVDLMNMSDSEFAAWRKSKRSRR
jgi:ribosome-binding protein aMBF1 (putative translation factor)